MSISLIIPSFDRPAQLDCLLRSLLRYWDHNDLNIKILYKYSNERFAEGYNRLFRQYWYTHPYLEYDFGNQINEFIVSTHCKKIMFFTDDCVCFRDPMITPDKVSEIVDHNRVITFSLRLGTNTTIQNYLDNSLQPELRYLKNNYNTIKWKWNHYPVGCNYNYIFSWDGHAYSKSWLVNNLCCKVYESPRAAEHQMSIDPLVKDINKPWMVSCKLSSVFCNTINRVQPNGPEAGTKYNYSPEYLNDKWLSGQRIDLRSFDGLELYSSHYEVSLEFEEYSV